METGRKWAWAGVSLLVCLSWACQKAEGGAGASRAEEDMAAVAPEEVPAASEARVRRGAKLVGEFQCNRCHVIEDVEPVRQAKNCVTCHQAIRDGSFDAPDDVLEEWQHHIVHLRHVPSLIDAGRRFRRDWLVGFLQEPHDLRPRMGATMPRMDMSESQARALAAYLVPGEYSVARLPAGDARRGRQLLEEKACGSCHTFSGVESLPAGPLPAGLSDGEASKAMLLAPDLRHTRERWRPQALVTWLLEPKQVKHDAVMPDIPMTEREAVDIVTYLLEAEPDGAPEAELPERRAPLERRVSYGEVEAKVFKKVCWHCHSDPELNDGDGGPGNTGGFGFEGRGLSLGSFRSVMSGSLDDHGERQSVFREVAFGDDRKMPLLLAVLYARHAEAEGRVIEGLRGMPMGLPPLPMEDIRLLETWIAQGRPR